MKSFAADIVGAPAGIIMITILNMTIGGIHSTCSLTGFVDRRRAVIPPDIGRMAATRGDSVWLSHGEVALDIGRMAAAEGTGFASVTSVTGSAGSDFGSGLELNLVLVDPGERKEVLGLELGVV